MSSKVAEEFSSTERFAVLRRIGAGGMGVVYEAYDRERGVRVALKTLPKLDAEGLYRLKHEFRSLSDVTHPNLVTLYELFSVREQWFFTMEFIDGVNFLEYVWSGPHSAEPESTIRKCQAIDEGCQPTADYFSSVTPVEQGEMRARPRAVVPWLPIRYGPLHAALCQLAEGVCALHEAGKLHRDIKPSNVLVTREGRVVLLDFGLVTELERHPLEQQTEDEIAGTLAYMAPEQELGLPLSPASDWYSVGVMIYEALTGRRPFAGGPRHLRRDRQELEVRPPQELVSGIPPDLSDLCARLLERRSGNRPSGSEVLRRLGHVPAKSTVGPLPSSSGQRMPFVGRERHLAALHDACLGVKQGQTVAVYVHGRSGVGKSFLVQRFLEELVDRQDVVVLAGRCYEQESVPYKALDSLVDALSRYLRRLPWQEATDLMPPDVSALARLFPVLRRVEAVADAPRQEADAPDPQELRRRAFRALRQLLIRLGSREPLILYIDDLQWGDLDSAALLADLLRPPDPPVLLLLGSYRSEYAATSPCLRALLTGSETIDVRFDRRELAVETLTALEARSLALELLGQDDPAANARAEMIARESGGSPYFIHELVQYLRGGAELKDRRFPLENITLDEVLWRRVTGLSETSLRLLELVTISGRPVRQADAYRAAGVDPGDHAALSLLRTGHLVRSTGPGTQDEIETYHDRIRETVVGHLPREALKGHHHRLAVTLQASGGADPETLAVHFHQAEEPERAGEYYALAAAQAAEALAFDRAVKLYRLTLELRPVGGSEGRELRTRLGDALANAGRGAEAAREYLAATAGAAAAEALELQRRAAMQSLISGHIDEGLTALRTVLHAVGMKLAPTPRRALLSLLLRRLQLRLRGLRIRERDVSQISAEDLTRIDICWSAAVGLSIVDTIRGADFQARNLLLALRAGEPYRIARALAWEAAHVANLGGPVRARTAGLLQASETLARRINHPHALGMVTLATGIAAYMEGRWKSAREFSERAEGIFRDRCTGVTWELDTTHSFALWSLFFLGEVAELIRRLPLLIKEARERGDLYAATNLGTFVGHLTWLAADDPEGARHDLREVMRQWSQQGFHVQHLTGLMGQMQIDLYRGDGAAAWTRITSEWPALARSLFLRVQTVRIFMLSLRARSALVAAMTARDRKPYLRVAERDARRLERERMHWSEPLARLIRAGIAVLRGDSARALGLLDTAAPGLEAADMGLFAAAARYRQGQLLGGEQGRALRTKAHAWMAGQKVKNPSRMIALHAPGFAE